MHLVNLKELIQHHPYHISTFAQFANITVELLEAALGGVEELSLSEMFNISKYTGVNINVLVCPKLIMLDSSRYRHGVMLQELGNQLSIINYSLRKGSKEADNFFKYHTNQLKRFIYAFQDNQATYCQYLGIKEVIEQGILFVRNENNKPRGKGEGISEKRK